MIVFRKENNFLALECQSDFGNLWANQKLKNDDVTFKNCLSYNFKKEDNCMFGISGPELVVILVILVIPGTIGAVLAKNKGRSIIGWFILSAIFYLPILIVLLLPPIKEVPGKYRECPLCKEFVKWNALLCKHCKTELTPK